ncbi:hypothetical protein C0J50_23939 [Silurus asotus]|uniref:High affinity immunoglobulin epsilon receptor subunit gamma n=1 Tax=Silurus asotus TaxID=30991 RepID=A0AAD5AI75_SILAS|nr:hypothetical protein C0J50_23939 [Silurus asotus]
MAEGGLCYILDGILIIYGIVLTVLYCRLRQPTEEKPEGIYQI